MKKFAGTPKYAETPNGRRAQCAGLALRYVRRKFLCGADKKTCLIQTLGWFRNLCDARGWDYGELDKEAYRGYLAGLAEERAENEARAASFRRPQEHPDAL